MRRPVGIERPSQRIPAGPERLMFSNAAKSMIKDNQLETPVLMSNKSHAIIILSNLTICNKLLFIMNTSLPCSKNETMFETVELKMPKFYGTLLYMCCNVWGFSALCSYQVI